MKKILTTDPIILFIIIFIAVFLRFYRLGTYPVGFHIDEASLGYNGYSLLKTGKDEHGIRFPLYIDMFGDNRPSGYHYLTVFPIAIFGMNEFSTRFPAALLGSLSVLAFYYFVYAIMKDKKTSLMSAFLLSIAPWHIVSSRASSEAVVALFFIFTGLTFVIESIQNSKLLSLLFGSLLITASFFFYHTPRVFVPLLLFCFMVLLLRKIKLLPHRFQRLIIVCFSTIVIVALVLIFFIKGGTGRFNQVSIFGSPMTTLIKAEQIREDGIRQVPPFISRIFHNKLVNYPLTFISNYLDYFSGSFLFIKGGRPLWYKVPGVGMLNLFELPFIIIGFIYFFKQKNLFFYIILAWLITAPLTASLTMDDIPNVQRVMVMFPMFEVLTAYGIIKTIALSIKKNKGILVTIIVLTISVNFIYFLHQYFVHASAHETQYRFNGFKEMMVAVRSVYGQYDKVIITKTSGGIYPHVLFFMQYDPFLYQKEGSPKDPDFGGFGKFIFVPQFCPSIDGDDRFPKTGRVLYVDSGTCNIPLFIPQKRILREDETTAFIIVYQ